MFSRFLSNTRCSLWLVSYEDAAIKTLIEGVYRTLAIYRAPEYAQPWEK